MTASYVEWKARDIQMAPRFSRLCPFAPQRVVRKVVMKKQGCSRPSEGSLSSQPRPVSRLTWTPNRAKGDFNGPASEKKLCGKDFGMKAVVGLR